MKLIKPIRTVSGQPVPPPSSPQGVSRLFMPALLVAATVALSSARAQTAAPASPESTKEDILVLTPFEVTTSNENEGYTAATTLAGNRLNTELRDIGSAV